MLKDGSPSNRPTVDVASGLILGENGSCSPSGPKGTPPQDVT